MTTSTAEQFAQTEGTGLTPSQFCDIHWFAPTDVVAHSLEDLNNYKPRKGGAVTYEGRPYGAVTRVDGNLCYTDNSDAPFIWRFRANPTTGCPAHLNRLFSWPEKVTA